ARAPAGRRAPRGVATWGGAPRRPAPGPPAPTRRPVGPFVPPPAHTHPPPGPAAGAAGGEVAPPSPVSSHVASRFGTDAAPSARPYTSVWSPRADAITAPPRRPNAIQGPPPGGPASTRRPMGPAPRSTRASPLSPPPR